MSSMTMPWREWEDFVHGMYRPSTDPAAAVRAEGLLADQEQFREAAREMLREWPMSAHHNLDHMWSGRRAWVGQATCCYSVTATAADTRAAWGNLDNSQQRRANTVADQEIERWRKETHDAQALPGM